MNFSELMSEGNLDKIKKQAELLMDNKIKEVLTEKVTEAKLKIGAKLATQSMRYK